MTLMAFQGHGFKGQDHRQHFLKMQFSGGVISIDGWQSETIQFFNFNILSAERRTQETVETTRISNALGSNICVKFCINVNLPAGFDPTVCVLQASVV